MKTLKSLIISLNIIATMFGNIVQAQTKGAYATVNGVKLYYVNLGKGSPVVLLHGAFSNINKDFGKLIPILAKTHQVIAIELQSHGHSPYSDRPMSYETMAGDVEALLTQLNIKQADFFGYSMGGGAALRLAIDHPELVRHLILASTAYSPAGMNMQNPANLKQKVSVDLDHSEWKLDYDKIAPVPADWAKLKTQVYGLMGSWKGFDAADLKNLKMPTMLIFGDEDMSTPEHEAEMFRLIGGGASGDLYQVPNVRLAILPGTTHVTVVDQTQLLVPIIAQFLGTSATK